VHSIQETITMKVQYHRLYSKNAREPSPW